MTDFNPNDLTCGGRLQVHPSVNRNGVVRMAELLAGSRQGGFAGVDARNRLSETLATSDASFALTHLINARNLPLYDEAVTERNWNKIASTEVVPDFKPATFYNLQANYDGLQYGKGTKGHIVAPSVPELDTYTYAYGYSEEQAQLAVEKRGFKWGVSLERVVNDPTGEINRVPGDMLNIGLDTDEFLVFDSVQTGASAETQLVAGETIDGTAVPANSAFSVAALRVLLRQISQRTITQTAADGTVLSTRKPGLASSYYIVVAQGRAADVEYLLAERDRVLQITDGNQILRPYTDSNLNRIAGVIESEFIDSETAWYVVPAAGTTRRTGLVRLQLAGYTAPEVYVSNFNGIPLAGGAQGSPYRAFHFDNDSVDLKFRQFTNAGLISQDQFGWSEGTE